MSVRELKISDTGISYSRPTTAEGLSIILELSWIGLSLAVVNLYGIYRLIRSWRPSDAESVGDGVLKIRQSLFEREASN